MKMTAIEQEMITDAARSGLSPALLNELCFEPMDSDEVAEFMGGQSIFRFSGYMIPYFGWNGDKSGYARIRRLGRPRRSFGGSAKNAPKYIQKTNTLPQLYIPKNIPKHRSPKTGLIKFPDNRLVITEGEKKAAAACAHGMACVALGGVYGFMAKKKGIRLLEEFDQIDYKGLTIDICYDSDASIKNPVRQALEKLAFILETEKNPLKLNRVQLTPIADAPITGLDDYLLHHSVEEFNALPRTSLGTGEGFEAISKEVVFVKKDGLFYNIPNDRWYKSKYALTSEYDGEHMITNPADPLGPKISAIELWPALRDKEQTTVDSLVYTPGKDIRLPRAINLWRPTILIPSKKGNPKLWLTLLEHLTSKSPKIYDFLLRWFAYPIQHPGAKLLTSVFMWSQFEGTGKNFLVEPFFWDIYGRNNMAKITVDSLESQFNTYAACKQFIITDEIYIKNSQARNATMGKLKTLITSPRITVNAKFSPPQEYDNHGNYYLTSNHEDALSISSNDRRFLVIEAPQKLSPNFYRELDYWAKEKDGASILYQYLLHEVDCEAFDPNAEAPITKAKKNATTITADPIDYYLRLVVDSPEDLVSINGHMPDKQLYTAADILRLVNNYALDHKISTLRISPDSMGRYLAQRIPKHKHSFLTAVHVTYYALLNRDKWQSASREEWTRHVRANVPAPKESTVEGPDGDDTDSNVVQLRRILEK